MSDDATASIRAREVEVEIGGWIFGIEALPAGDWIEAVLTGDLAAIFPGLLRDRALEGDVWTLLLDDTITRDQLIAAAHGALADAAGRTWWEATRLIAAASNEKGKAVIFGRLIRDGFDFGVRPLGAFLDAVYSFAVEDTNEDQRLRLDMMLRTPPAGVDVEEIDALYSDEDAEADFMAALGDTGSGA